MELNTGLGAGLIWGQKKNSGSTQVRLGVGFLGNTGVKQQLTYACGAELIWGQK